MNHHLVMIFYHLTEKRKEKREKRKEKREKRKEKREKRKEKHSINKIWLYSPMLGGNKKRAFAEYDCFTNANSSLLLFIPHELIAYSRYCNASLCCVCRRLSQPDRFLASVESQNNQIPSGRNLTFKSMDALCYGS
jgi:hypothetical protein